jgi:hypothetical protein
MVKLLHIGMGRSGSTYLRTEIFPKVAKKLNISYDNLLNSKYVNINKNDSKIHILEYWKNIENYYPEKFIISRDNLFSRGWEFIFIEKLLITLKIIFQKIQLF